MMSVPTQLTGLLAVLCVRRNKLFRKGPGADMYEIRRPSFFLNPIDVKQRYTSLVSLETSNDSRYTQS